jgi:adenylosuccinate lyase
MSSEQHEYYPSPLSERYASREMSSLFSNRAKFRTWRRLWLVLLEAEKELGLAITDEQVAEVRKHQDDVDLDRVAEIERTTRHDVMAHLRLLGEQCPKAKPVLHLGATSAYLGDNTDLLQMRDGLHILERRIASIVRSLANFARAERATSTLGYTHFQPAQLVTVGKRACLWLQDLLLDASTFNFVLGRLRARGAKGTTGTQASFLTLFAGDHAKVEELDRRVAEKMGFPASYPVTGQTYPRKVDAEILGALAGVAASAAKFATDLRLLMSLGEMEEPIDDEQVGSSAMAYKRNPVRSERIVALSRHVIALVPEALTNASNQWLERSLDDSANRRLMLPEAFLATDAILILYRSIVEGLRVNRAVIARAVERELPFLATETVLMEGVRRGGDRQELHERVRAHSFEVKRRIHEQGEGNDLMERLGADPAVPFSTAELVALCEPRGFTGRAAEQVDRFLEDQVAPYLESRRGAFDEDAPEVTV